MPPLAVACAVVLIVLVRLVLEIAALLVALISGFHPDLNNGSIFGDAVLDVAFAVMVAGTMIPLVMLVARFVQWRRVGFLLSVEGRLRWKWLLACAAGGIAPLGLSFAVVYALTLLPADAPDSAIIGGSAGSGQVYPLAVVLILLFVPLQSSAEEIAIRGFVMQAVGSYGAHSWERRGSGWVARALRTPVPAIVISGAVFALMHQYTGWALLDTAVFGAAMGWVSWYTGGLEAAIGLHALHNLVVFTIAAFSGTLGRATSGSGSWQGLVATTVEVGLYLLFVVWLARRVGLRRTVPAENADHEIPGPRPTLSTRAAHPLPAAEEHPRQSPTDPGHYEQASFPENPRRQRPEQGQPARGGWVYPPDRSHYPDHW